MYIEPTTNIRIIKNSPCDSDYTNTVWFDTQLEQMNYFFALIKYNLTNQSYQRYGKGVMRIFLKNEDLYDCNYLAFQNTLFGNKWFYAFIDRTEYISNNVTEVYYTIDDIQTWMFDGSGHRCYTVNPCFVEREHSATDNIGDNLIPEDLPNVEMQQADVQWMGWRSPSNEWGRNQAIIVVATKASQGSGAIDVPASQWKDTGVFSGLYYNIVTTQGYDESGSTQTVGEYLTTKASTVVKALGDSVQNIFMIPQKFAKYEPSRFVTGRSADGMNATVKMPTSHGALGSYQNVRNNKLHTYPFELFRVDDGGATVADYRFEWFSSPVNGFPELEVNFVMNPVPEVMVVPLNYNNIAKNITEQMSITTFPQCSYSNDALQAYLASHGVETVFKSLANLTSIGIGLSTGNVTATGAGVRGFANTVATLSQMATKPDMGRTANTPVTMYGSNYRDLYYRRMVIRPEYARIYDDFFDKYGYATKRVKVPNTHARPYWTYTKTLDCTINGSIPVDAEKNICNIYNNGITFWTKSATVGDYTQDNRVSI